MFKRILPLLPSASTFGWAVLLWTMLSHASTAQFTVIQARAATKWLGENAWAGFVIGFGILALAVFWPDIEPRMRWIPKSQGARLADVEAEHTKLAQNHADLAKRSEAFQNGLGGWVAKIEKGSSDATTKLRAIEGTLTEDQSRLQAIESRWKYAKVDEALPDHENRLRIHASCLQGVALLSLRMDDTAALIHRADECYTELSEIVRRYPKSEIAKAPFSKAWRPLSNHEPPDEATRLGLGWSGKLMSHVDQRGQFPTFDGTNTQRLIAYVLTWDSADVTAQDCLSILKGHKEELDKDRNFRAARFADSTLLPVA